MNNEQHERLLRQIVETPAGERIRMKCGAADLRSVITDALSLVDSQVAGPCKLEFEAKLLGFPNQGDRIKLCETCLVQAIADNFVISSSGIPQQLQKPVNRDYLTAEIAHLTNPQSDWPYGHRFQRQEDGSSKCRCGFTLTPLIDVAISMRSACIEKVKEFRDEWIRKQQRDLEHRSAWDVWITTANQIITALESVTIQEQEKQS